jgi:hypothetical protein
MYIYIYIYIYIYTYIYNTKYRIYSAEKKDHDFKFLQKIKEGR